jgi:hypothetical protein
VAQPESSCQVMSIPSTMSDGTFIGFNNLYKVHRVPRTEWHSQLHRRKLSRRGRLRLHVLILPIWDILLWYQTGGVCCLPWQKLHSHAYTRAMVCSFVSFTHYLIYLRRRIAKKIRLWRCLFASFVSF